MTEPTLREFIETKLVISGFAVDQALEGTGILAWPRGMETSEANFILAEKSGVWIILSGTGRFAGKKMQKVMERYLKQWIEQYKFGAR